MAIFIKGIIMGISIAAPVGPIALLVIQRTFKRGHLAGFITGLGAATADVFYGTIVAFGLVGISQVLVDQQMWLQVLGGAFLIYLGVQVFRSSKKIALQENDENKVQKSRLAKDYFSGLFFTATNPITILLFLAIFAGLGVGSEQTEHLKAFFLVLGVFSGALLWVTFLTTLVHLLRSRTSTRVLMWVQYLSGVFIAGFGVWALISAIGIV